MSTKKKYGWTTKSINTNNNHLVPSITILMLTVGLNENLIKKIKEGKLFEKIVFVIGQNMISSYHISYEECCRERVPIDRKCIANQQAEEH